MHVWPGCKKQMRVSGPPPSRRAPVPDSAVTSAKLQLTTCLWNGTPHVELTEPTSCPLSGRSGVLIMRASVFSRCFASQAPACSEGCARVPCAPPTASVHFRDRDFPLCFSPLSLLFRTLTLSTGHGHHDARDSPARICLRRPCTPNTTPCKKR
jgi:hypothetical protein